MGKKIHAVFGAGVKIVVVFFGYPARIFLGQIQDLKGNPIKQIKNDQLRSNAPIISVFGKNHNNIGLLVTLVSFLGDQTLYCFAFAYHQIVFQMSSFCLCFHSLKQKRQPDDSVCLMFQWDGSNRNRLTAK